MQNKTLHLLALLLFGALISLSALTAWEKRPSALSDMASGQDIRIIDNFETYTDARALAKEWFQPLTGEANFTLKLNHSRYLSRKIHYANNKEGLAALHILPAPLDFTNKTLSLDARLSRVGALDPVGCTFGSQGAPFKNMSVLLFSAVGGLALAEVPPGVFADNAWSHLTLPQTDFYVANPAFDWTRITSLMILVASGNGRTGNKLTVDLDNLALSAESLHAAAPEECEASATIQNLRITYTPARKAVTLYWQKIRPAPENILVMRGDPALPLQNLAVLAELDGARTQYRDTNVTKGESYQYAIIPQNACDTAITVKATMTEITVPD